MKLSKVLEKFESTGADPMLVLADLYDLCFSPHLSIRAAAERNLIHLAFPICKSCSSRIENDYFMGLSVTGFSPIEKVPSKDDFFKSVSESDVELQLYLS